MTWIAHGGVLKLPPPPYGSFADTPLYVGAGSDAGLFLYQFAYRYIVSSQFVFSLLVDGVKFDPVMHWLNGYCYFSDGSRHIWYSEVYGWVLTWSTPPGYPLTETWTWTDVYDSEKGGAYVGDGFYAGGIPSLGGAETFVGRGSLRGTTQNGYGGKTLSIATTWDYWQQTAGNNLCGVYEYKGNGEAAPAIVGLPRWRDNNGAYYTRSLAKSGGHYSYGAAAYDDGAAAWIIGTYNSASGWLQSDSEPNKTEPVTFTATAREGAAVTGSALTLTFVDYVLGGKTQKSYDFNVGKWHS